MVASKWPGNESESTTSRGFSFSRTVPVTSLASVRDPHDARAPALL